MAWRCSKCTFPNAKCWSRQAQNVEIAVVAAAAVCVLEKGTAVVLYRLDCCYLEGLEDLHWNYLKWGSSMNAKIPGEISQKQLPLLDPELQSLGRMSKKHLATIQSSFVVDEL